MTPIRDAFDHGEGVSRLAPNWVPHNSNHGGTAAAASDDFFAFGMQRGSIKERWFCSTVSIGQVLRSPPMPG